jgi:hypothetical protein
MSGKFVVGAWGSMMNQTAQRLWEVTLSMPGPSCLIDRFLDWVEQRCGAVLAPARFDNQPGREAPIETRRDQFVA